MAGEGKEELFDLAADIGETHNLADRKPDLARELVTALQGWNAELAQPLWGGP